MAEKHITSQPKYHIELAHTLGMKKECNKKIPKSTPREKTAKEILQNGKSWKLAKKWKTQNGQMGQGPGQNITLSWPTHLAVKKHKIKKFQSQHPGRSAQKILGPKMVKKLDFFYC